MFLHRWLKNMMFPPPAGRSRLRHAPHPLPMPTPDGSGQLTHPDVVFFDQPWRGHHYWLAFTPYPFMDERQENPCILVSDDGLHWALPQGGKNPLVTTPVQGFHADPDLLYHPLQDQVWLYYLHTVRNQRQWLKRLCSADGRHWSAPEVILELPYQEIRSPALAWKEGRLWLWSVNMSGGRHLELRHSPDGVQWSPPRRVVCPMAGHTPSHLDVLTLPTGEWGMVVQATPQAGGPNPLFWRTSNDGLTWQGPQRPLLAAEDGPPWSTQTLYRASAAPLAGGYGLWYGGRAPGGVNHVGLTPFSLDAL